MVRLNGDEAGGTARMALVLALALAVGLALPFAFVTHPPMDDYPAHLARYFVMANIAHDPLLQQVYRIDWRLSGNLGVDLLVLPLARVIGVEAAARLVAAAIPVLTGLGLIAVEFSLRRRLGVGALLAMATVWSPALRMGFLNFTLSLALALLVFALWVRAAPRGGRGLPFVVAGLLVWLCHLSGWGVLGLLVLGHEWVHRRSWPRAVLATWPLWPPALLALLTGPAGASGLEGDWGSLSYKADILFQALRGDHRLFDLLCLGLLVLAILEARGRGAREQGARWWGALDPRLLVPALLVLAAALVMPRHFGGGDFADARLVPVALMLGCLAISYRGPRWTLAAAALPAVLRLGLLAAAWHGQSQALERLLPALDRVPAGARIASAVVRDRTAWSYPAFSHVGAYATLRREALVNAHFALPGIHLLQLRGVDPGFADPSQVVPWAPGETVDLRRFAPARQADYLWYVGPQSPAAPPPVLLPPGAEVLYATDRSVLVRLSGAEPGR